MAGLEQTRANANQIQFLSGEHLTIAALNFVASTLGVGGLVQL